MNPTVAKIARRTVYFLLLLVAVLVILGSIILSQLDLDNYRHELESKLSSSLGQPVRIGQSKLTFNKGIAVRFRNLQIGPEDALLADIPYLTATLKIAPLFDKRIFLDKVEIDEPKLQFWLPVQHRPDRGFSHQLTDQLGIRILTVRDASIKLYRRQQNGSEELLNLKNLHAELHGWQPNQRASLTINGSLKQPDQPAEFVLDLTLPTSTDPQSWRQEELAYQLHVENLHNPLSNSPRSKPQPVRLDVSLAGVPAEGAQLTANLLNIANRQRIFNLTGTWQSSQSLEAIQEFSGTLLGLPLTGHLQLQRQDSTQTLTARLGSEAVPLTAQLLTRWQLPGAEKLLAGTLEQLQLKLEKSWPIGRALTEWPQVDGKLAISGMQWSDNGIQRIEDFFAELTLDEQLLAIHNGRLVTQQQPILFSGQVSDLLKNPQLDLQVKLQAKLQELFKPTELPADWKISGSLPAQLALTGSPRQPEFQLQADLTPAQLQLDKLLQKKAGAPSSLQLSGSVSAKQLQLDRLEWSLPGASITGNGCFSCDNDPDLKRFSFDPISLPSLHNLSPLSKELNLQGELQASVEHDAQGLTGNLQLADVGAHLKDIVADLQQTNGHIVLNRDGLRFQNLATKLGESAFQVSGQLSDWQNPRLELHLQSDRMRARDLIFRNPQLTLYNLDGKLLIDRQGIRFAPVNVALEDETVVTVTGSVQDFSAPQVTLDIEAERANIDQVIQLFVGPRKHPPQQQGEPGKPLLINARVKQGSIGELPFTDAEGVIRDHLGVFTIYPLRFLSGQGYCQARIEFEHKRTPGLLKVSGHAEGINATILHQELFKTRGLLNGTLQSDFYVEGDLQGEAFWRNARGGIHLQIEQGTLRKFRGLARVFSILNVSQLFSGKLPDMDTEGMPFNLLEGSVRIADGRAHVEEMRINSEAMNMSLVGSQSLIEDQLDYNLVVMPLRTVDKVITKIPIAGWVLGGEDKALLTAHFKIEGTSEAPEVKAVPVNTLSNTVFGIVKRTLGLPGKLVKDIGGALQGEPPKKTVPE